MNKIDLSGLRAGGNPQPTSTDGSCFGSGPRRTPLVVLEKLPEDIAGLVKELQSAVEEYERLVSETKTNIEKAEDARFAAEKVRAKAEELRIAAEEERAASEAARQSAYELIASALTAAENDRVAAETLRESAEALRQSTFETNEKIRAAAHTSQMQSQATAYTNAEAYRNGAYQEAEEDRDGIFNLKEATRDAANQAALGCAETLAALGLKIDSNEFNSFYEGKLTPKIIANSWVNPNTGAFTPYNGWSQTDYVNVAMFSKVKVTASHASTYGAVYDKDKQYLAVFKLVNGVATLDVTGGIVYVAVSDSTEYLEQVTFEVAEYKTDAIAPLSNSIGALQTNVQGIKEKVDCEMSGKMTIMAEQVGSTRLSRALPLPFTGSCNIKISVYSGTDSGQWRLYRNINGELGEVLTDYANFGDSVDVVIPSTDSGVWLFTNINSGLSTRTYKVEITSISQSIKERFDVIESGHGTRITNLEANAQSLQQTFYDEVVTVNTAAKRSNPFAVSAGMKIRFGTSIVSGEGSNYTVYHTSVDNANKIFSNINVGNKTDVYTVPNGVDTIIIFVTKYGTGTSYRLTLYNALNNKWQTDQMIEDGVMPFVKNYTPTIVDADLEVSSSAQYIIADGDTSRATSKSGDIYMTINSCSASFASDGRIRCLASDNSIIDIYAKDFGQKTFKIFSNKTLNAIYAYANAIESAGHISLSVYSIPQSMKDLSYPLKDRRIMCFGDSITEFRNSTTNMRYSDYLTWLSQAITINVGIGGTRLAPRATPSSTPSSNQDCVAAFDIGSLITAWASDTYTYQDAAIDSGLLTETQQSLYEAKLAILKANPIESIDIVTIFAGTNDYTGGTAIGTASASNNDNSTLYGAINTIIAALAAANPRLKVYMFSPIIRMFESTISIATSSDVYVHASAAEGKTLPQFCEVIEDAARLNHIPFCNWYWTLGWNVHNFTAFFGNDYTHPYSGFRWLAEKIYNYILSQ